MRSEKPNVEAFAPNKTKVDGINFQFSRQGGNNSNAKQLKEQNQLTKPFKFSGNNAYKEQKQENKILSNITNSSTFKNSPPQNNIIKPKSSKSIPYKPYTGRLGEWNPKKTLEETKTLANRVAPKTKKGDIIKGVRLNRRAELLMKKRGLKNEN